ncbi:hypothetical protein CLOP_g20926 [Closterium sp. NIES-67]|nr:hypothetical protein CLOP_g20926 [Closterium sp. NIES-67]
MIGTQSHHSLSPHTLPLQPSVPHEAAAEDGSDNDGPLAGYILVDSTLPCSPSSALAPAPGAQTTAGQER